MKIYLSLTPDTECLAPLLQDRLAGRELMIDAAARTTPTGGGPSKMQQANEWGADLYLALRTGKNGLKLLAAGQETGKSWAACTYAWRALRELDPPDDNRVENGDYIAEIAQTSMTSIYAILPDEAGWVEDNAQGIAEAAALAAEQYFDEFCAPDEPDKPDEPDLPEEPECPETVSDAELGRALRTIIRAWRG